MINDNSESAVQSDVEIQDTSKKTGFFKRFGALFDKSTPHSGFNVLIVILAAGSLLSWWWWSSSTEDEHLSLGTTSTAELNERNDRNTAVPDQVVDEILAEDATKAEAVRAGKGNYAGARPDRGVTSIADVLNDIKAKPAISLPEPVEPEIAPISDFKPAFSTLDLTAAKTTSDSRVREADLKPHTSNQAPANPLTAYALKLREAQEKDQNKDAAVFNGGILFTADIASGSSEGDKKNLHITKAARSVSQRETNTVSNVVATDASNTATTKSDNDGAEVLALRAGHFAYAYTLTAVDTDVEAQEVVAEIGGGLLHGARLIGSWKRLGNWYEELSLVFKTMELNGEVYPVNLIAFNNSTHLPAFVDDVDRHLLLRWGGLITGSLLEAAKVAAEASAGSTETYNAATATSTVTKVGLSDNDVKAVLLTSTGSQIAEKLKGLFDRPITSRVFVGRDMRLLAMEPVLINRTFQ